MIGTQYYEFLRSSLYAGQTISAKPNLFVKWLIPDGSLQFSIPNNKSKSIPKKILIAARNAHLSGTVINNNWLIANGCNRGWCLADALNGLFLIYP